MTLWKVTTAMAVFWALGMFFLGQATYHKLEGRIAKLQKDNQALERSVEELVNEKNQLTIALKNHTVKIRSLEETAKNERAAMSTVASGQALSAADLLTLKLAFDDIQGEVAAGKLKPLALMDAYGKMQKILNSPGIGEVQSTLGTPPTPK